MLLFIYWCKILIIINIFCWIVILVYKIMVRIVWYLIFGNNIEFVFDILD